jgi:hypothetical protein
MSRKSWLRRFNRGNFYRFIQGVPFEEASLPNSYAAPR